MGHFGEKNHQQTFFTVCVYSKMHPTGWRLKNRLFQIIPLPTVMILPLLPVVNFPFPSGRLCGRLQVLIVMLGAVATLRIKHNSTAINRRQADQRLTTFEREKQATWQPKLDRESVWRGRIAVTINCTWSPLVFGKQFEWMGLAAYSRGGGHIGSGGSIVWINEVRVWRSQPQQSAPKIAPGGTARKVRNGESNGRSRMMSAALPISWANGFENG